MSRLDTSEISIKELKSEKLKEICLTINAQSKPNEIPYRIYNGDVQQTFYPFCISISHYSSPTPFPLGSISPICLTEWETLILDNVTGERLAVAVRGNIFVRVKASRHNPKAHFRLSEGFADITDIRRVFLWGDEVKHLTMFTYMKPT